MKVLKLEVDKDTQRALEKAARDMPRALQRYVGAAMRSAVSVVEVSAKQNHRFKTRSGDLLRSVQSGVEDMGLSGFVELNDAIAEHGKYIHDGFKSWAPDPFVEQAFTSGANMDMIEDKLSAAIDRMIDELF